MGRHRDRGQSLPDVARRPENYANPEAYSHAMVALAIRDGRLLPPDRCEACGLTVQTAQPVPGARKPVSFVWHHWSLHPDDALDVIGLDRSCHAKVHRGQIPEPRTGRIYREQSQWKRPARVVQPPLFGGEPVTLINRPRKRKAA